MQLFASWSPLLFNPLSWCMHVCIYGSGRDKGTNPHRAMSPYAPNLWFFTLVDKVNTFALWHAYWNKTVRERADWHLVDFTHSPQYFKTSCRSNMKKDGCKQVAKTKGGCMWIWTLTEAPGMLCIVWSSVPSSLATKKSTMWTFHFFYRKYWAPFLMVWPKPVMRSNSYFINKSSTAVA